MQTPPSVAFHGFEPDRFLNELVQQEVARLERFSDEITTVRVVVDQPHQRHRVGSHFDVHIQVGVPGDELVVDRGPGRHQQHEEAELTIRQAFRAARRQLQDWVRQTHHLVKAHEPMPAGRILRLFPYDGYGIIQSDEGEEVYFHENAVVDVDFDDLEVGRPVRFVEEQGVEGPQASTVYAGT